jgi:hypothetical protein
VTRTGSGAHIGQEIPDPNLTLVPSSLYTVAYRMLARRNAFGFVRLVPDMERINLVWDNLALLRSLGIYEAALVEALTAPERSLIHFPEPRLSQLIRVADRVTLRAIAPLPGHGPFVLYRGVAGDEGWLRRERGISWTGKPEIAAWFARRSPDLRDPAVYQVTVDKRWVLGYWNEREEDEYLVQIPRGTQLIRLPWGPVKLKRMSARYKKDTFDHRAARARGLTQAEILRTLKS